jgi:hypothetical protein
MHGSLMYRGIGSLIRRGVGGQSHRTSRYRGCVRSNASSRVDASATIAGDAEPDTTEMAPLPSDGSAPASPLEQLALNFWACKPREP